MAMGHWTNKCKRTKSQKSHKQQKQEAKQENEESKILCFGDYVFPNFHELAVVAHILAKHFCPQVGLTYKYLPYVTPTLLGMCLPIFPLLNPFPPTFCMEQAGVPWGV